MKAVLVLLLAVFSTPLIANTSTVEPLEPDEGYAIIALYSKGYTESVVLKGSGLTNKYTFGPLNNSQHFDVLKLPAGTYTWDRVFERTGSLSKGNLLESYMDLESLDLTFTVQPGKLNYTGLLMIERLGSRATIKVLNRTSIILKILEQDFTQFADKYDMANGLYPDDHYIDFYLKHAEKTGE